MAANPPNQNSGGVSFNYTIEQAKTVYYLVEKPAGMTEQEWAIVSDEGFRKYLATQLKIPYVSRQELKNRVG